MQDFNKVEYRLVFGSDIDLPGANVLRTRICQILERVDFGVACDYVFK